MLKQTFKDQGEFIIYTVEQQLRMEKGYLPRSERDQLKKMQEKDYKPTIIKEEKPKLPIVTNIKELRKLCQEVTKEDNIKEIIQKLKDTLESRGGLGITANQIGIQKKISYIKIPKMKDKQLEYTEMILINAKVIEKKNPIKVQGEGCISFPGITIDTLRYVYCTCTFLDENLKETTGLMQGLESLVTQHECDHQNSITFFERKYKAK